MEIEFFQISSPKSQENSPVLPLKLNDEPNIKNESPVLSERRNILQETNNILGNNLFFKPGASLYLKVLFLN